MEIAEQIEMIRIDLKGIFILLRPYVKPTPNPSTLTANAKKKRETQYIGELLPY